MMPLVDSVYTNAVGARHAGGRGGCAGDRRRSFRERRPSPERPAKSSAGVDGSGTASSPKIVIVVVAVPGMMTAAPVFEASRSAAERSPKVLMFWAAAAKQLFPVNVNDSVEVPF